MSNNTNKIPDFLKIKDKTIDEIMRFSSVTALNFFKSSFEEHGFTDTAFTPWQARKSDGQTAGNLMQPTGNLRDSLQILSRSRFRLVFGTHTPYAKIHNEGGTFSRTITVTITKKSRKFFWAMYYETKEVKWKWMALTKKTQLTIKQTVKMPKRQFIGHSKTLMDTLEKEWVKRTEKNFKQHLKTL